MKIGFLGNTNNYPFMIARAMRKLGHEVLFIVDRGREINWHLLYRPENRYDDISLPYPDWIKDVSPFDFWYNKNDFKKVPEVVSLLKTCDAVFLNQSGPSLLPYIQKPAIVHLTGSDLEVLANFDYADEKAQHFSQSLSNWRQLIKWSYILEKRKIKKHFLKLINNQRNGISSAIAVAYFAKGLIPNGDKLLDQMEVKENKRIFFFVTDLDKIQATQPPSNSKIRLFNVARLNWKQDTSVMFSSNLDNKRTDILLNGILLFFHKTKVQLDIRLVEKGNDIIATQNLVKNLGLAEQVTWLTELSQLEVFKEYEQADIITENLGEGQWAMGAMDAMAAGRPVIANARYDLIRSILGEPPPICHAQTPEEVCQQLYRLVLNKEEREKVGRDSRLYAEKYFSAENAAKLCIERLSLAVKCEKS
jgi:glycosyltransferase involved in cell wall biosynthesis